MGKYLVWFNHKHLRCKETKEKNQQSSEGSQTRLDHGPFDEVFHFPEKVLVSLESSSNLTDQSGLVWGCTGRSICILRPAYTLSL